MSCEFIGNCLNGSEFCWMCKWRDSYPQGHIDYYKPLDKKVKHPQREQEKKKLKEAERLEKIAKKKTERSKVVRNAAKTEDRVKSSLNSGRVNKDSDLHTDDLVVDVKSQINNMHPVINIHEFYKVQEDAKRAGKKYGVLALVNKDGETFYVLPSAFFQEIIS